MADTVKIPGLGETNKKTVYLVGGLIVVVAGYGYYRSRQAASAPAPATTGSTDTSATDTSTDTTDSGLYPQAPYDSGMGQYPYGYGLYEPTTQPTGFTENSQWAQAAEDYLANTVGLHPTDVQAALGKYLTGGTVNDAQESIINQAIAAEGYPPQSGPNGYPPAIKKVASHPSPSKLPAPHLKFTKKTVHQGKQVLHYGELEWTKINHAAHYYLYDGQTHAQTVTSTSARINHKGRWTVVAVPASGTAYRNSDHSNAVNVTTL